MDKSSTIVTIRNPSHTFNVTYRMPSTFIVSINVLHITIISNTALGVGPPRPYHRFSQEKNRQIGNTHKHKSGKCSPFFSRHVVSSLRWICATWGTLSACNRKPGAARGVGVRTGNWEYPTVPMAEPKDHEDVSFMQSQVFSQVSSGFGHRLYHMYPHVLAACVIDCAGRMLRREDKPYQAGHVFRF